MRRGAEPITSAENPKFKRLVKLQQSSRERRKAGRSLLDGVHLVAAYLEHAGEPEEIVVAQGALAHPEVQALVARASRDPLVISDGLFRSLSTLVTPTGVLAVVETPRPMALPREPGACLVLENLQDPGNVGSILRSAAAAGVSEAYLSPECVQAWSPRVLRAGMGAHFALRIHEGVDLEAFVRSYPGRVIAASPVASRTLYETDLRGRVALAFGNEGAGLTPTLARLARETLRIPMPGAAESLNVAAAAAVCLFERVRQECEGSRVRGQ